MQEGGLESLTEVLNKIDISPADGPRSARPVMSAMQNAMKSDQFAWVRSKLGAFGRLAMDILCSCTPASRPRMIS